jgi:hypothetical protein
MDLQLRRRGQELQRADPDFTGDAGDSEPQPATDNTNVAVSYGIHQGRYPIGGMTVREARRALQRPLNIDDSAVAVINGAPVAEDQQISADVTMLSFVKPSAMKGARAKAEKIIMEGQDARLTSDDKSAGTHSLSLEQFVEGIVESTVRGLSPEPLPDNVKWCVECHSLSIYIVQLTPQVRWIKWLDDNSPEPYGPGAVYAEHRLATPYVVLKVPFWGPRIVPRIEVFYRNRPLESLDGDGGALFWPNLYNVSVNAYRCTAWYCSQHLPEARVRTKVQAGLNAVVHHLFGGGFNASSEAHEGLSTFGLCVQEKLDPRITDVQRWAEATRKDPRFVLGVEWKPTGLTVKDLIERELKFHKLSARPQNTQALGTILLRKAKPK